MSILALPSPEIVSRDPRASFVWPLIQRTGRMIRACVAGAALIVGNGSMAHRDESDIASRQAAEVLEAANLDQYPLADARVERLNMLTSAKPIETAGTTFHFSRKHDHWHANDLYLIVADRFEFTVQAKDLKHDNVLRLPTSIHREGDRIVVEGSLLVSKLRYSFAASKLEEIMRDLSAPKNSYSIAVDAVSADGTDARTITLHFTPYGTGGVY